MIDASEAAAELLRRRAARRHLFDYIRYTNPKYKPTGFARAVCSALDQFLDDAMAGKRPILILQAPPQHGKSEIVSRKLPAYLLGRYPDLHVGAASYSDPLANSMSQAVRRNLASAEHAKLFPNAEGRRRYDVDRNGEFTAPGGTGTYLGVGIGSGLTGRSVDCLVAGTPIETDRGPVRIEELKTLGSSCKVLSYRNGRLSYERIKAFASGPGFGIWRVATARGRIFEATAGHRVFTSRGYVRTDELAEGDVLLSAMRRGAHNLCSGVQKAESEVLFSGLRGESESCRKSMRRVWRSAPARFISKVLRKLPKKRRAILLPSQYPGKLAVCPMCQNEFVSEHRGHGKYAEFCSKICAERGHAKRMSGRGNPKWKNGMTPLRQQPHSAKSYRTIRPGVLLRDDYACVLCGKTECRLEVHHIDGNPTNNPSSNLVTLCAPCHNDVHRQMDGKLKRTEWPELIAFAKKPLFLIFKSKSRIIFSLTESSFTTAQ